MARITIDGILYDVEGMDGSALAQRVADALDGGAACTLDASRFGGPKPVQGHLVIAAGQSFFITG
ncbi:hypothetical protein GCM10012320_12780 [Sinomonas cellulolyticus]|jgi:hypothetical protein|uniref:Uncharacterized protein n=1 Tax=Sinomonas cellulolyticus TaxID=2801916 RepID=A0ABS1JZ82_9MICC|nr:MULTISPECIES: hypothetical protein [Sinomonas]MBL0704714.1 hypothetical protein [Sinomonas cellulolyticus]GHG46634.1 hypothetical protein GCM10012320_12780 [Sinomonas sp. KCTC 49339]